MYHNFAYPNDNFGRYILYRHTNELGSVAAWIRRARGPVCPCVPYPHRCLMFQLADEPPTQDPQITPEEEEILTLLLALSDPDPEEDSP